MGFGDVWNMIFPLDKAIFGFHAYFQGCILFVGTG